MNDHRQVLSARFRHGIHHQELLAVAPDGLLNPPVMFSDDGGSYVYAYRRNLSKLFVVNGWR